VHELIVENESIRQDIAGLREANQELAGEKAILEDRLTAAQSDKDRLWETMQKALEDERFAYQTMINQAWQKQNGGIPYPEAHSLPPETVRVQKPGPIGRSARILPSEMASRNTRQFVETFVESLAETT